MNPHNRNRNWNEFQWEREIRRDEQRISRFFSELSGCLDLPGAEEGFGGPQPDSPSPVSRVFPGIPRDWKSTSWRDHEDEDEANDAEPPPRNRADVSLIDELDMLSSEWNLLAAGRLRANLQLPGLGVSCAAGKLLGRIEAFADASENGERALKLSLGKRALADLNDLVNALQELQHRQNSIAGKLADFIEELGQIRERLFDRLTQLRRA